MPTDRPAIVQTPQQRSALRQAALRYAERGFRVLPLWWPVGPDCACGNAACGNAGKHPYAQLVPRGWHDASSDPARIEHWWRQVPDANVGIVMGENGTVAIDIDPRNGGHITWEAVETEHGTITDTPIAETGSGGQHILVSLTADQVLNCVSTLGQGIDVKASGYIVAEPSLHASGRKYAWRDETDLLQGYVPAAAPPWLQRILTRPAPAAIGLPASPVLADPRTAAELRSAIAVLDPDDYHEWIHNGFALHATGWGAEAYEIWDEWSQRSSKYQAGETGAKWAGFGRNPERPAITYRSIFARAQKRGWVNPMAGFVPAQMPSTLAGKQLLYTLDELAERAQSLQWLVKHALPEESLGVLFGASGAFKSFVAIDITCHVGHGMKWLGKKTRRGCVVYIAAEGGAGVIRRFQAWHRRHNKKWTDADIHVCPVPLELMSDGPRLRAEIERLSLKPDLIVVDTMSQTFVGEENSASDVAAFFRSIGASLRDAFRSCVLVVHHSGHNASERPRGSSAIVANTDFMFGVHRDEKEMLATLTCIKQKDAEKLADQNFALTVHELGRDEDGEAITSLAASHIDTAAQMVEAIRRESRGGRGSNRVVFEKLATSGSSIDEVREQFYAELGALEPNAKRQAWNKCKTWAIEAGILMVVGDRFVRKVN